MRKIEIVEHVINNTTISRSQAIQAVDCAFDAIEKHFVKVKVSIYVVLALSRLISQKKGKPVISTREQR